MNRVQHTSQSLLWHHMALSVVHSVHILTIVLAVKDSRENCSRKEALIARNYSAGGILSGGQVTKGPARPLGGVWGTQSGGLCALPTFFPHPAAAGGAREKRPE